LVCLSKGSTYIEGVWEQVPRIIFGPKREEVTGGMNEKLHNF
jgi:hypothetical protein